MKPKFSWEPLDGGSLLLRVADGDKTTTWTVKPRQQNNTICNTLQEVASALWDRADWDLEKNRWDSPPPRPMVELVRTVDAEEFAELKKQPITEEESRQALAAKAAKVLANANWFEREDDAYEDLEVKVMGKGTTSAW